MADQKKILIIEDDIDLVEANKIVLEANNHHVIAAYTPDEGFLKTKTEKPDLVILDVMFGHKGQTIGFDIARKLKMDQALAKIPILMVTAVNMENPGFNFSAKDGEYIPVDAFINKPAQPKDLAQKVESLLEKGVSKWVHWPDLSE